MTQHDREKFRAHVRTITNPQCWTAYDEQMAARRLDYASLVLMEIVTRGLKRDVREYAY